MVNVSDNCPKAGLLESGILAEPRRETGGERKGKVGEKGREERVWGGEARSGW